MNKDDNFSLNNISSSSISFTTVIRDKETLQPEEKVMVDENDMPVLELSGIVPFPEIPIPVNIGNKESMRLVREAETSKNAIFLSTKLNAETKKVVPFTSYLSLNMDEGYVEISKIGVIAKVIRLLELPDGTKTALVVGMKRGRIRKLNSQEPYLRASVTPLKDKVNKTDDFKIQIALKEVENLFKGFFNEAPEGSKDPSISFALDQQESDIQRFNLIAMNGPIPDEDKLRALNCNSLLERVLEIYGALQRSLQFFELKRSIFDKASSEISQQQKDHFLQTEMRMIREELGAGDENDEIELRERAMEKKWSEDVEKHFVKELQKLSRFNTNSPDYAIQYAYLDAILNLPWEEYALEEIDIPKLQEDLDRDHFGLEKVKERIIEHIAVLKLKNDMRSPILCLYGPPGVGKTSLCKSIADSIKRDYARISLGGLHDEAEIRGHRKTYIGAMPGRILNALSKCKTSNPVFVLDEIDKIGKDYKGDPAQALLEVLDPEQNSKFHDNYLDIDYDLSKVFFIATANTISTISAPLLDRMELIDISGYIVEEKIEIARCHLIPKLLADHGFSSKEVKFDEASIRLMIESYTRESGVRKLEKVIAKVLRKIAVKKASGLKFPKTITLKNIGDFLGKKEVNPEVYEGNDHVGVVTGLAWTAAGGEILFIESSLSAGKGNLTLTGNLGDVMKESATIALQWLRANAKALGIDTERFAKTDVHVHVPEGAVPKDGPSAGITMVTSLASSFTGRKVRSKLAMTGEVTLRGKVLPVGGIKEKILAAKRAGITDILISEENRKDIEEIKNIYVEGLEFHFVKTVDDVLGFALLPLGE